MAAKDKPPTFESALEELEAILSRIESGEAPLEESLRAYEKGMKLVGHCRKLLDHAEARVKELTLKPDGSLRLGEGAETDDAQDASQPTERQA